MTIDQALEALELAGATLPREAMQWLLDHWEQALPTLHHRLDSFVSGEDRSEGNADAVLFIAHLAAEKAETRLFPSFCALLLDSEATEFALGEAGTESLCSVLIAMFDGDRSRLTDVIEYPNADEFIRAEVMLALAYLTRTGRIDAAETRAWLVGALTELQPHSPNMVWIGWLDAVAALGLSDLSLAAEKLFQSGWLPDNVMEFRHFQDDLALTLGDPTGMAMFKARKAAPFTNAIATLGGWYCFSAAARKEELREADKQAREARGDTTPKAHRNIGRNDPCPCGSGKKYKKCCLIAA